MSKRTKRGLKGRRRRIGKDEKEMKRLEAQYRRYRKAKGDKRFGGIKNLVKWSRKSKSKRKGKKKRSIRIYHRKRKTMQRKKSGSCVKQTIKKYISRNSPPYPANKCCGRTIKGNDGKMYKSVKNKSGTCQWRR